MPCYCYICSECDYTTEVFRSIESRNDELICSECNNVMKRDIRAETVNTGNKTYNSRPIHSDSLAIMPSQVAEHRRMFPDIKLDKECRPVFDNFKQHDNYLKKIGAVKEPQRIKRKGKRIA